MSLESFPPICRSRSRHRRGTVEPGAIPVAETGSSAGSLVRVIAGSFGGQTGPAQFAVTAQILDVVLAPGDTFDYVCPKECDNVM